MYIAKSQGFFVFKKPCEMQADSNKKPEKVAQTNDPRVANKTAIFRVHLQGFLSTGYA
jgi:hypothetical protein